jgi:hypothetical protein
MILVNQSSVVSVNAMSEKGSGKRENIFHPGGEGVLCWYKRKDAK